MKKQNASKSVITFFKVVSVVSFIADALAIYQLIRVLTGSQDSWPTDKIISLAAIIILAFLFAVAFMYFGEGDQKLLSVFAVVYIVYSATFLLIGGLQAINGTVKSFEDMLYYIVPSLVVSMFAYFMVTISNTRNIFTVVPYILASLAHISWYIFRVFTSEDYNTSLTWNIFLIILFILIFLFYRLSITQDKVAMNPDFIDELEIKWNFALAGKTAFNTAENILTFAGIGYLAGAVVGGIIGGIIGLIAGGWDYLWEGTMYGAGITAIVSGAVMGFFGGLAHVDETNNKEVA